MCKNTFGCAFFMKGNLYISKSMCEVLKHRLTHFFISQHKHLERRQCDQIKKYKGYIKNEYNI